MEKRIKQMYKKMKNIYKLPDGTDIRDLQLRLETIKRKNPIIFLDFDGVVNTIYYRYYPRDGYARLRYANSADNMVNNEQAIAWLNALFKKYDYDIVVTSTWRFSCDYENILYNSGLNRHIKILGHTPKLEGCRGDEICTWIIGNNCRDRDIIILDDDTDMGVLMNDLIKCDPYLGFTIHEYQKCIDKFKEWDCMEKWFELD